jgi:hypothetical protein
MVGKIAAEDGSKIARKDKVLDEKLDCQAE